MIATLSLPIRRFAALGLLMAVLLLLWESAVDPIVGLWISTGSADGSSVRLLQRYRQSIGDEPYWVSLQQKLQSGQYADLFVEATNRDLGAAKLQQDIKAVAEANGGNVNSIQVLPPAKQHAQQRLGVRINFTIPVERLASVLAKYDHARPYLYLDNLTITAPEGMTNAKPVQLTVKCDFFSFMRPGTP